MSTKQRPKGPSGRKYTPAEKEQAVRLVRLRQVVADEGGADGAAHLVQGGVRRVLGVTPGEATEDLFGLGRAQA